ncbi:MAG: DUF3109 family protein [Muribaculaceae bacterium]|nr:DUF3109 family protein [Muribaculaceae bacterium]
MFQIGDNTLVSLDLVERFFSCDLDACLGACCIDGDAGAPITEEEYKKIKEILPEIWDDLLPRAKEKIKEEGVGYYDPEAELVTQLLDGQNCVFSCYAPGGKCICAIEKAYREGRIDFFKPISCHLYPVRLKKVGKGVTAVNYDRWKICRPAEALGRKRGVRVYEFLREPLIRRFGQEWYDELAFNCKLYIEQYLQEE